MAGFIKDNVKKNNDFKQILANLALADANHDFKELFTFTNFNNNRNQFNDGLPYSANEHLNEKKSVFDVLGFDIYKDELYKNIKNVETTIKLKYGTNSYNAIQYRLDNSKGEYWEGKDFIEKTRLGPNIVVVVDFAQSHFMTCLKNGPEFSNYNVHYLMTPELLNDPGPKPNIHDSRLFREKVGQNSGVNLRSYIQKGQASIKYTEFNDNDTDPKNNFFSKYNFTLSGVLGNMNNKVENLKTDLTITNSNNVEISKIKNGKISNSIESLKKWIKNYLINKDTIQLNAKFQQKRSGDWFQALSCLDIENRDFESVLPKENNNVKIFKEAPVYLVTHDQILLAYALLNGVNVIYISVWPTPNPPIYVFKNIADKKTNSKPIAYYQFIEMKEYTDIGELIQIGTNFKLEKDKFMNAVYDVLIKKITDTFNILNGSLEILKKNEKNNNSDTKNFQKNVQRIFIDIFKTAIQICFIELNIKTINVENDNKNIIDQTILNIEIPTNDADIETTFKNEQDAINILYNAFNNLRNIKNKFWNGTKNNIENWVTKNNLHLNHLNKLDLLVSQQKDEKYAELYIFLSYLEKLDPNIKKQMVEGFNTFRNINLNDIKIDITQKKKITDRAYDFFKKGRFFLTNIEAKFDSNVNNLLAHIETSLNKTGGASPEPPNKKRRLDKLSINLERLPYYSENTSTLDYDLMTTKIVDCIEKENGHECHPLLPIYMLLSISIPFYEKDEYLDYYKEYLHLIHNIAEGLIKILSEHIETSYLIGCGLCYMLFASCNEEIGNISKTILSSNFKDENDLNMFFITNNSLVSLVTGYISLDEKDINNGILIMNDPYFIEFIQTYTKKENMTDFNNETFQSVANLVNLGYGTREPMEIELPKTTNNKDASRFNTIVQQISKLKNRLKLSKSRVTKKYLINKIKILTRQTKGIQKTNNNISQELYQIGVGGNKTRKKRKTFKKKNVSN